MQTRNEKGHTCGGGQSRPGWDATAVFSAGGVPTARDRGRSSHLPRLRLFHWNGYHSAVTVGFSEKTCSRPIAGRSVQLRSQLTFIFGIKLESVRKQMPKLYHKRVGVGKGSFLRARKPLGFVGHLWQRVSAAGAGLCSRAAAHPVRAACRLRLPGPWPDQEQRRKWPQSTNPEAEPSKG